PGDEARPRDLPRDRADAHARLGRRGGQARRLDRRDGGRVARGPLRAHDRRDGQRPGDPDNRLIRTENRKSRSPTGPPRTEATPREPSVRGFARRVHVLYATHSWFGPPRPAITMRKREIPGAVGQAGGVQDGRTGN